MNSSKIAAVGILIGCLIFAGSSALCHAQSSVAPGAPSPLDARQGDSDWEWSDGADNEMIINVSVPITVAIQDPAPVITPSPNIVPEPSTAGLIAAGAVALWRFGARKRSR